MSRPTGVVHVGGATWVYSLAALDACGLKDGQAISSFDDLIRLNETEVATASAAAAIGKAQIESLINPTGAA